MPATIVIGAQWGDEGKGKIVDVLSEGADVVVRFGGGANAGHTLVIDGKKHVLHLIPSGILRPNCHNVLGGGCVVDAAALLEEMETLRASGVTFTKERLLLAETAHVVTPYHRMIDKLSGARVGTTGRGIGPAYADKALRIGVRLGDLVRGTLTEQIHAQHEHHGALARALYKHNDVPAPAEVIEELVRYGEKLAPLVGDPVPTLLEATNKRVLLEGAQGVLLDIDHGTYPFVTSSNTTVAGALAGLGVHMDLSRRIAVMKAYTTRVGNGPFPTELLGKEGEDLRTRGHEFGATTGRPRRCGWLDMPLLKRAFQMNGFTHIALTKLDVLSGYGDFKVMTSSGERVFPGFDANISTAKTRTELPASCQAYLDYIESELGAQILLLSTGPGREQTLINGGDAGVGGALWA
jgi:adenylosuccinate synthase